MHPVIAEAQKILESRRPKLRCDMFNHLVIVRHADGSHFEFHNAICQKQKVGEHNMLLIWTEHCGYHAFFCDDLDGWGKFSIA